MLTWGAWAESSKSAPGVNLRCRKPLGGTFVSDEVKAALDNRLCIEEGKKKKVADNPEKECFCCCNARIKHLLSCTPKSAQLSSQGRNPQLSPDNTLWKKETIFLAKPFLAIPCSSGQGLQSHFASTVFKKRQLLIFPTYRVTEIAALTWKTQFHQAWSVVSLRSG